MATDEHTTVAQLKARVKKICDERDWSQFHTPKDIAIMITVEASEVLEHFRYKNDAECLQLFDDPKKKQEISDELSDTLYNILRFAQLYDIDLASSFESKMAEVEKKYPVELSKGKPHKYTHYRK